MYAGRIVEHAKAGTVFASPEHPYTWGLLKSIPRLDTPRGEPLVPIPGRPPSLINRPSGCSFHPRCPYVRESHKKIDPVLEPAGDGDPLHRVACLLPSETRRALWQALKSGGTPDEVKAQVPIPEDRLSGSARETSPARAPAGEEVSGS
jgi:peptide/nickel transport system ATP-binding protein